MEIEEIKKFFKLSIPSGNILELIDKLKSQISNKEKESSVILLETKYRDNERENLNSTISKNDYDSNKNKVIESLLHFIESLTPNDLVPPLINSKEKQSIHDEDAFKRKLKFYGLQKKLNSHKGVYIYKREFIKFKHVFIDFLREYSRLSSYKFHESKHRLGGVRFKNDYIEIDLLFCTNSMVIAVNEKLKSKKEKTHFDKFTLQYNKDFELVWFKSDGDSTYTTSEIVQLILQKIFSKLMKQEL